jgi:hypothetical protein
MQTADYWQLLFSDRFTGARNPARLPTTDAIPSNPVLVRSQRSSAVGFSRPPFRGLRDRICLVTLLWEMCRCIRKISVTFTEMSTSTFNTDLTLDHFFIVVDPLSIRRFDS